MELLLIRHARPERVENHDGPADPPLNTLGQAQARVLAEWLADEPIEALYSSTARRARETAEPLAQRCGLPVAEQEELVEFDWGSHSYIPAEEALAENHPILEEWQREFQAEGRFADFCQRGAATVERIVAAHPGQTVAVVTHGGIINAYASAVLGIEPRMVFAPTYASLTRMLAGSSGLRSIVSLNETGHLRGLEAPASAQAGAEWNNTVQP